MDDLDERWDGLTGGYRTPYDPRRALRSITADGDAAAAWKELWQELHHQGGVGEASYVSIVLLARWVAEKGVRDWNPYALAVTIEEARGKGENPSMPAWLAGQYAIAWEQLFNTALTVLPAADTEELICSLVAVLAIHKRQPMLARMAILTEAARQEMLDEVGWA